MAVYAPIIEAKYHFFSFHNVKFSENRAVRGFRWNVLLNAFYYFSFIFFVFAFFSFNAVALIAFMQLSFFFLMQLSISAFNVEFSGASGSIKLNSRASPRPLE